MSMDFDFKKIVFSLKEKATSFSPNKGDTPTIHRDWLFLVSVTAFLALLSVSFGFYIFYQNSYSSPSAEKEGGISFGTFSREKLDNVVEKLEAKKQRFEYLKTNRPVAPAP